MDRMTDSIVCDESYAIDVLGTNTRLAVRCRKFCIFRISVQNYVVQAEIT